MTSLRVLVAGCEAVSLHVQGMMGFLPTPKPQLVDARQGE
jgi:hypothetical protein